MYDVCECVYVQCVRVMWKFIVALKRIVAARSYFFGLHSSRDKVMSGRLGTQRRRASDVPGGVWDRSGVLLVI